MNLCKNINHYNSQSSQSWCNSLCTQPTHSSLSSSFTPEKVTRSILMQNNASIINEIPLLHSLLVAFNPIPLITVIHSRIQDESLPKLTSLPSPENLHRNNYKQAAKRFAYNLHFFHSVCWETLRQDDHSERCSPLKLNRMGLNILSSIRKMLIAFSIKHRSTFFLN